MVLTTFNDVGEPSFVIRQRLNAEVTAIDGELASIDAEILTLRQLRETLASERSNLLKELRKTAETHINIVDDDSPDEGKKVTSVIVDYTKSFEWTAAMKARMKNVFGIDNFRLCQEA
jgi:ATP-dependent DNA helicase Q1